jgi:hypothetical protein
MSSYIHFVSPGIASYAANLRRELPRILFPFLTTCHPKAGKSLAGRETPDEGSVQVAGDIGAAGEHIGLLARKVRGPQDVMEIFEPSLLAGQRLAEIKFTMSSRLSIRSGI